jgi:EpsI family protein
MHGFKVRYVFLIIVLVFSAAIAVGVQIRMNPGMKGSLDISGIPLTLGEWKGVNIPVENDIKSILETDMVLMRQYAHDSENPVSLAVVYYKNSRVALHLPESCLMGQGSRLINRGTTKIALINDNSFEANTLLVSKDGFRILVLYFFETGNLRTNSYFNFRWRMLMNKLKGRETGGALIRFTTEVTGENDAKSLEKLKKFIGEIGKVLPEYLT